MRFLNRFATIMLLVTSVTWAGFPARLYAADEPSAPGAPRLLPERTIAYLRLENADEFRQGLASSATGKMLADPKLKPLVGELYGAAQEIFEQLASQLGLSLDEVLSIPEGQVAFGLYVGEANSTVGNAAAGDTAASDAKASGDGASEAEAAKDESPEAIRERIRARRANAGSFGALIIIETGEDDAALAKILQAMEQRSSDSGFVIRRDTVAGTEIVRIIRSGNANRAIEYFSRNGTTIIGFGPGSAEAALMRWNGQGSGPTLAESTDFAAVMSPCIGAEDTRPQITFFFDPYRAIERAIKGAGGGAALVWPIIEELGFGKIRGIGGSIFQGGETFDNVTHMHVLLDPPRDGIFSVVRPSKGDTNPPNWVPEDVASYVSVNWRVDATFNGFEKVFDRFAGENGFANRVTEPFKTETGLDLRESLINTTLDRGVMITWLQQPVTVNSNTTLLAVELKDPAQTVQTIEKLRETIWKSVEVDNIGSTKIYRGRQRDREVPEGIRQPEPCGAVVGNWLMVADSRQLLEHVIRAENGAVPRLIAQPDYDLVASELGVQLGSEKPFLLSFSRDSEALRQIYEMAKSPQVKEFVRARGEQSPIAKRIAEMIERNELPPFDEFKKYFAPTGGFAYDEPTGMHFGRYTLKPE